MMLPILISVSLAPVSYFFWARALEDMQAMAGAARAAVRRPFESIVSPSCCSWYFRAGARWDWNKSPSCSRFLIEHDLFGKPLHTFPDHALSPEPARQLMADDGDLPRAVRDQEYDQEE